MIEIRDLNLHYAGEDKPVWALRDLNLSLKGGVSYGVLGESGCGKSTLAMAILRLLPADVKISGEILFEGRDLLSLSDQELRAIRWKEMAVVFQASMNQLSPVHRVRDQIRDVYRVHVPEARNQEIDKKVLELFARFNLNEKSYKAYPHELSGGMMQRVSIALSLLHDPKLLIMDEATTALDVMTEQQILDELLALEKDKNFLRLSITHDVSVVSKSCEEVLVMYGGHVVEQGKVRELFNTPRHPYTKALLESFPDLSRRGERLQGITGSLLDLREKGPACAFAERCPYAQEACFEEALSMTEENGRYLLCHYPLAEDEPSKSMARISSLDEQEEADE